MRQTLSLLAGIILFSGCTHRALQNHTVNQVSTLTDLRSQTVLANFAILSGDPSAIPFYSVLSGGGTQVLDGGNVASGLEWKDPYEFSKTLGLDARRELTENWQMDPVNDPEKLRAMRAAYQWALFGRESLDDKAVENLRRFEVEDQLSTLPQNWICCGDKRDLPKGVCLQAKWCRHAVWVLPENHHWFHEFVLIIQDIATIDLNSLHPPKTKVTEVYTYDTTPGFDGRLHKVERTTETLTTQVAPDTASLSADLFSDPNPNVPPTPAAQRAIQETRPAKPRLDYSGSDSRLRSLLNLRSGR